MNEPTNSGPDHLRALVQDGVLNVALGSRSPAKLAAVAAAFALVGERLTATGYNPFELSLEGVNAASGVADQPWGEADTRQGALNRAEAALAAGPTAQLALGIEAGVVEEPGWPLWTFAWVVILGRDGVRGAARSATFAVPEQLAAGVRSGLELGDALDAAYGLRRAKDGPGAVGVLTGGLVDRPELYRTAVLLALTPWLQPRGATFLA
ncbi:MAG: inosine/xanthosine triphosphatase [Trueperaceae bacterium]